MLKPKKKSLLATTQDSPYIETLTLAMSGDHILLPVIWIYKINRSRLKQCNCQPDLQVE